MFNIFIIDKWREARSYNFCLSYKIKKNKLYLYMKNKGIYVFNLTYVFEFYVEKEGD